MKLTTLKNLLVNAIESNSLLNQTNRIKLEADIALGPVLEKMSKSSDGHIVSKVGKGLIQDLCRQDRRLKENKIFDQMATGCKVIAREAELLEKSLDSDNAEFIMREALNIREGHILQFITIADFFVETVRTLATIIQEVEVYQLRDKPVDKSTLNYIERNFTGQNIRSIAQVIAFFVDKEKEEIISKIYELPDIKVDETILTTIQSTEGSKKIDPVGFNPLNIINPTFYAFTAQKIWSEMKFYRLEKAENEIMYLELRHQELTLLREGKNNPDLERKIGKYQDKIQGLRVKIQRIKDSMG